MATPRTAKVASIVSLVLLAIALGLFANRVLVNVGEDDAQIAAPVVLEETRDDIATLPPPHDSTTDQTYQSETQTSHDPGHLNAAFEGITIRVPDESIESVIVKGAQGSGLDLRNVEYVAATSKSIAIPWSSLEDITALVVSSKRTVGEIIVLRQLDVRVSSALQRLGREQFSSMPWRVRTIAGEFGRGLHVIDLIEHAIVEVKIAFDSSRPLPCAGWRVAWQQSEHDDATLQRGEVRVRETDRQFHVAVGPDAPLEVSADHGTLSVNGRRFLVGQDIGEVEPLAPGERRTLVVQYSYSAFHIRVVDSDSAQIRDAAVTELFRLESGSLYHRSAIRNPQDPSMFVIPYDSNLVEIAVLHPLFHSRTISFTPNSPEQVYEVMLHAPPSTGTATFHADDPNDLDAIDVVVRTSIQTRNGTIPSRSEWRYALNGGNQLEFSTSLEEWVDLHITVRDDMVTCWPDEHLMRGDRPETCTVVFSVTRRVLVRFRVVATDVQEALPCVLHVATEMPPPEHDGLPFSESFAVSVADSAEIAVEMPPGRYHATVASGQGGAYAFFEVQPGLREKVVELPFSRFASYRITNLPETVTAEDGLVTSGIASPQVIARLHATISDGSAVYHGIIARRPDSNGDVQLPEGDEHWWFVGVRGGVFRLELNHRTREAVAAVPSAFSYISGEIEGWSTLRDADSSVSFELRKTTRGRPRTALGGTSLIVEVENDGTFEIGPLPSGTYDVSVRTSPRGSGSTRIHDQKLVDVSAGARASIKLSVSTD